MHILMLKHFADQDYLEMINNVSREQYGEFDGEYEEDLRTFQEKTQISQSVIDLTESKKEEILEIAYSHRNFRVGKFLVKITCYSVRPTNNVFIKLSIYEKKDEKIITRINILKDNRFSQTSWKKHFTKFDGSEEIPINIFGDIIKWLQITNNLSSFF